MSKRKSFHYYIFIGIATLLIGVYLLSIWQVSYLPFQDHPSHLLRVHILLNYHNPAYDYMQNYIPRWFTPYLGSDLIIFLLGHFFSVEIASKIFYSLYIVLFPLSLWYFLRAISPGNSLYAFLALPMTFNFFVLMGNENFLCSIPVFLIVLGYWFQHKGQYVFSITLIKFFLATLLCFCHMFTFALALGIIFVIRLIDSRSLKQVLKDLIPFLAGIIIFIIWLLTQEPVPFELAWFPDLATKITHLKVGILPGLSLVNLVFLPLLMGISCFSLLVTTLVSNRKMIQKGIFLVIPFLMILSLVIPRVFFFLAPGQRVIFFALLLATAVFPNRVALKYIFVFLMIAVTIYCQTGNWKYLHWGDKTISNYVTAFDHIPPRQKVLPLILSPYNTYPPVARVFEYYHLKKGGINPEQFASAPFTLLYRKPPPPPDPPRPRPELRTEIIDYYDQIMIVGDDSDPRKQALVTYVTQAGFQKTTLFAYPEQLIVLGK